MNHRKILGILLGLSLFGIVAGFGLNFPDKIRLCDSPYGGYGDCNTKLNVDFLKKVGFCSNSKYSYNQVPSNYCSYIGAENIGQPIMIWSFLLFIVFVTLIFLSKEVFSTWKKFAIVIIPLSIIAIIATPISCQGIMCYNKETTTLILGIGFAILSLIIIIYKSVRMFLARRKSART